MSDSAQPFRSTAVPGMREASVALMNRIEHEALRLLPR
jgi:hypothetical protein